MGFKALTVNTAVEAAGHIYAEDDAAIFLSQCSEETECLISGIV